ncbi:hypothetical protein M0R45_029598 [Rubus argutus]|uniref:KIB1-4 beta-propeller domain-containing protein n=1 Tax=Rubus argutus TaxID=59490 RepID=A0AAW1W8Y7_RUBAR
MMVTIYLLNPITGARIMLPPLYENPWISVASSNPTCSDCIVATIIQPTPYKLAFCRPGDKSWTYQLGPKFEIFFRCLQFHKDGKLYAFASALEFGIEYLVVFDPLEVFSQAKSNMYKGKQFEIGSLIRQHRTLPSLMISFKGEILLVWNQYLNHEFCLRHYLQNANPPFLVCKLDVQTPEPELIKMNTLEDQTIFIRPSQSTLDHLDSKRKADQLKVGSTEQRGV